MFLVCRGSVARDALSVTSGLVRVDRQSNTFDEDFYMPCAATTRGRGPQTTAATMPQPFVKALSTLPIS